MQNKLTTFYLVRHGETDWNIKGLRQGHTDIPLNSQGELQAVELAGKLKHIHFDHIFSSDLLRAKRTAEIIALDKKIIVKTTEALRERMFGKFEGRPMPKYFNLISKLQNLSADQLWQHKLADEESQDEAHRRLILFIRETSVAYPGKNILIVSHGGVMGGLLIKLGYIPHNSKRKFSNCAYIILESDGADIFLKEVTGLNP